MTDEEILREENGWGDEEIQISEMKKAEGEEEEDKEQQASQTEQKYIEYVEFTGENEEFEEKDNNAEYEQSEHFTENIY